MKKNNFLTEYFIDLSTLLNFDKSIIRKLELLKESILNTRKKGSKILIFGNGGSAAIANHFTLDITKTTNIRCINLNESSIITAFANDFGYENWVAKSIKYYADNGDLLILISSSGNSKNMIKAAKFAKNSKKIKLITLTGFNQKNSLKKLGDINLWIDSKSYNFVENIHQIWLLSIVDYIKGKREYSQNK
ncbi:MAG: Phosphoheptose isomerase [Alphaproteobacteria bacterium MarineAlpha5_Bin12]|nr:MAG: Phosphoheptose isomerase [Alphaproteobacteria bacterium MarineAlpha5_Bin12]|tara:strand:+ start:26 stop:598 length:573 start_codon:yes stop_codon:yes gene_type:complete